MLPPKHTESPDLPEVSVAQQSTFIIVGKLPSRKNTLTRRYKDQNETLLCHHGLQPHSVWNGKKIIFC